jgi:hypothetical protein
MCPASRTLLAAAIAGMVVSSILANDAIGLIVAFAVGVVVHLVQRRRPALATCALTRTRATSTGDRRQETARRVAPAPTTRRGTVFDGWPRR